MRVHIKKVIYENRRWKVTGMVHTNGTYSGTVADKINKGRHYWIGHKRYKDTVHGLPHAIPNYIKEKLTTFVKEGGNDDNFTEHPEDTIHSTKAEMRPIRSAMR